VRAALDVLETLGVTRQGLADTAARMGAAREALARHAYQAVREIANVAGGSVTLDRAGLFDLPAEIRRRVLAHTLCWVASEKYPPRNAALVELETAIRAGTTTTLHGCLIAKAAARCSIGREPGAVVQTVSQPGEIWDRRWRLTGRERPGQTIRATGANGLKSCPNWREAGLPRATLVAAPAVWSGGELVAAPLAGFANSWRAELIHDKNHFYTSILSH